MPNQLSQKMSEYYQKSDIRKTKERQRLEAYNAEGEKQYSMRDQDLNWKLWGPYVSEREWGTVREHYDQPGAWDDFSHEQARSRAYRWGEDGLAGICDDHQLLSFAMACYNEKDPIIKERLFGFILNDPNLKADRPVFGGMDFFNNLPRFDTTDYSDWLIPINFYEYYHGDNGAGLGASHQTGWSALVANLIQELGVISGVNPV